MVSKLEELINKYCPDGVEYKKLSDVCGFQNGYSFKSTLFKENGLPIIRITNLDGTGINMEKLVYFDINDYDTNLDNFKILPEDIVVAMSGATTGKIGINNTDNVFYLNQRVGKFKPNENYILNRYLYHYLLSKTNEMYQLAGGGAQPNLSSEKVMKMKIAVPPLEVQCEIVHILDDFTLLSAELSAELKARQEQYDYYRDKLLSFNGISNNLTHESFKRQEIKCYKLKDVAEYSKDRINAKELTETNYVGVDNLLQNKMGKKISKYVPNEGNFTKYNEKDILIGNIRPYLKKIWFSDCTGGTNGDVLVIKVKSKNIIPEYLYLILSSNEFFNYDNNNSKGAKMPRGNKEVIMNFEFYLPNIEEQEKIVLLLNKFGKLCNNISDGLPAEIEARRIQYEYYRNKLLNFKELK